MTIVTSLRAALEAAVTNLPAAELPELAGALAAAQARVLARLTNASTAAAPCDNELVPAEVVAERFHLALSTVHELARQGRLPCRMFGRYRRFSLAEVGATVSSSESGSLGPGKGSKKAV